MRTVAADALLVCASCMVPAPAASTGRRPLGSLDAARRMAARARHRTTRHAALHAALFLTALTARAARCVACGTGVVATVYSELGNADGVAQVDAFVEEWLAA